MLLKYRISLVFEVGINRSLHWMKRETGSGTTPVPFLPPSSCPFGPVLGSHSAFFVDGRTLISRRRVGKFSDWIGIGGDDVGRGLANRTVAVQITRLLALQPAHGFEFVKAF